MQIYSETEHYFFRSLKDLSFQNSWKKSRNSQYKNLGDFLENKTQQIPANLKIPEDSTSYRSPLAMLTRACYINAMDGK